MARPKGSKNKIKAEEVIDEDEDDEESDEDLDEDEYEAV